MATTENAASTNVKTFCRICEPSCGLVAQVDDGVLVKLSPDRDHPVTKGFACHKGLAAVDLHHDPDRLDHPMLRAADGTWTTTSWDDALARHAAPAAGDHRRRTASTPSPPTSATRPAFNALGSAAHRARCCARSASARTFTSGTQDCANKFVASEAVFGTQHRAPDPRPRPHRPVPHHRREPTGVAGQLLLDPQRARRAAPGHGARRAAWCSSTRAASRRPSAASATRC